MTKLCVFALIVAATIACVAGIGQRPIAEAQTTDPSASKLNSLRQERRDVLRDRVEVVERLVQILKCTEEELIAARNDLLDAEYEVATDSTQRVTVLQRKVQNLKQLESLAQQRKASARGTEAEVLNATAMRLAAEIELLRVTDEAQRPE